MSSSLQNVNINAERINSFKTLCEQVSQMAQEMGIELRPYSSEDVPHFANLSEIAQTSSLNSLKIYSQICKATLASGSMLSDAKVLLWHAIQSFGLRPTSDLFNFVQDYHVIEIHDLTGIQIFRNFEFYRFCSYSIEELYCISWNKLFFHEASFTEKIIQQVGQMLSSNVKTVVPFNIDDHVIQEVNSVCGYQIKANIEYGAPLYDQHGNPAASIVLERGQLLNPENTQKLKKASAPELQF